MSELIPLPFTCQHAVYTPEVALDDHGNAVAGWADGVAVSCFWWPGGTAEPFGTPTGSEQATADLTLVVDSTVVVDHQDRFTVNGKTFEVFGLPKEYDHGPFGYTPGTQAVELKWVG